ncbi:MAG: hypothetical protein QOD54_1148 [Sphingomonadales bacterium]|nr:hypothetical protein [Sphingomonadales bacterium]
MQFVWIGFLKADEGPVPQDVQQMTNDFLQQPFIKIHSVGPMRDAEGRRAGMMMVFEVDDFAKAEAFVKGSPYLNAGLYETHHLFEYQNEVG